MDTDDLGLEIIQSNLLMVCEFQDIVTQYKRYLLIFQIPHTELVECTYPARWVVEYRTERCRDHNHASLFCDIHRHKFMTSKPLNLQCTVNSEVFQVKKLQILSISTL